MSDPDRKRRRFGLNLSPTGLDVLYVVGAAITAVGGGAVLTDQNDAVALTITAIGAVILVALAGFSDWWGLTDEQLRGTDGGRMGGSTLWVNLLVVSIALAAVAVLRMAVGDGSWFTRFVLPAFAVCLCIVGLGHALARRPRR